MHDIQNQLPRVTLCYWVEPVCEISNKIDDSVKSMSSWPIGRCVCVYKYTGTNLVISWVLAHKQITQHEVFGKLVHGNAFFLIKMFYNTNFKHWLGHYWVLVSEHLKWSVNFLDLMWKILNTKFYLVYILSSCIMFG